MSEYSDRLPITEGTRNVRTRLEKRRKLSSGRINVRSALAAGTLAAATLLGVAGAEKLTQRDYPVDSYYSGKIEIVMNPNLNLRESPLIISDPNEPPNTVEWENVEQVKSPSGEFVTVKGHKSFTLTKPLITLGQSPNGGTEKGYWVTFDAKVDQGFGIEKDEKLYVSLSSQTQTYVKSIEPGNFIKLDNSSSTTGLGTVTLNP